MTGYEVAKFWFAGKAHFNSDFDISKYGWTSKLSEESFRIHRDRFIFERIAREYKEEQYVKMAIAAVLYNNPKAYIKELIRPNKFAEAAIYRHAHLYENFPMQYISFMLSSAGLYSMLLNDEITPENAAICYDMEGIDWIKGDWWGNIPPVRKIKLFPKYAKLIGYDKAKIAQAIKDYQKKL